MSGTHAKPGSEPIRDSLWRPLSLLALIGLTPPAVIVLGPGDARSAPAPTAIEQPDAPSWTTTAEQGGAVIARSEQHADVWGWR